ncbi:DUF1127 domain-containing protein [Sagittula sp. NFXS13]|uniref:DUF1127 domain-containing protein n=1 Tax=Sagittula sp. NFXS13 TaxID=2819095 RepID=UPI0032DF852B
MATFNTNTPSHADYRIGTFFNSALGLYGTLNETRVARKSMFARWKDARATRKILSALSDRELDDIGLARSDIDSVSRR